MQNPSHPFIHHFLQVPIFVAVALHPTKSMFPKHIITALAALSLAAIVSSATLVELDRRTAPNPFAACGPPKNEGHKAGDSCKFKQDGATVRGTCVVLNGAAVPPSLFCSA
ncbi:hypothetical protein C8R43DRAFT_975183 [Mycena crocata]|nr:hypothetical protein C8R43DRAFT_975183 [Mycena crocata]